MIENVVEHFVNFMLWLFVSTAIIAKVKVECDLGWNVGGVKPDGTITCMEPFPKGVCCGDAKGPCEKPCGFSSKQKYKTIYCTGGSKPVVRDHTTVGCTR